MAMPGAGRFGLPVPEKSYGVSPIPSSLRDSKSDSGRYPALNSWAILGRPYRDSMTDQKVGATCSFTDLRELFSHGLTCCFFRIRTFGVFGATTGGEGCCTSLSRFSAFCEAISRKRSWLRSAGWPGSRVTRR
jgi:hypothetical protein